MSLLRVNITDNWGRILDDVDMPVPDVDKPDYRTGYYCRNATQDVEAYMRYLNWVQALMREPAIRKSGPTYMLNLGYIPICAVPTFWDKDFTDYVVETIRAKSFGGERLTLYTRTQFGLSDYVFLSKNISSMPDWWASKMDISRLMGIAPESVTVKEVFRRCGLLTS